MTQWAASSALRRCLVTVLKGLKAKVIRRRMMAGAVHMASACVRKRMHVGLLLALLGGATALPVRPACADVFKYIDEQGNVFFSDGPLSRPGLRLEWQRTEARLVASSRERSRALQRKQADVDATEVDTYLQARLEAELSAEARGGAGAAETAGRRAVGPVSGSMWVRRMRYQPLIEAAARRHGLVPELLHAVIRAESAYRSDARSHAGACGLMQLMPGTAERFRVTEIWDPAQNIEGGAAYLRFLLDLFDHDIRLALAGYNAGEHAVKRHGYQIPPYAETQHYVRKVLQFLRAEEASWAS